jgi:lipopolysaccharide biosynthesis regulator YciM
MIDREHHTAQELATEAAAAYSAGQHSSAAILYRRAAEHEARALANVPADKPRTRGIVGVSLAALHFKAGHYDRAHDVAKRLLANGDLQDEARLQLEEIVDAVQHALQEHA